MTVARGNLAAAAVGPEKRTLSLRLNRYFLDTFCITPLAWQKLTGLNATLDPPLGTDTIECGLYTGVNTFEFYVVGTQTASYMPILATDGGYELNTTTNLAGIGLEINFGGIVLGHPRNFTPSSEDWFVRVLLNIANASGVDVTVGMRKVAAYAAAVGSYTDLAGIRILGDSSSTTAAFTAVANLNNSGLASKTIPVAGLEDATAVELEVRSISRKARFFVNGVEYSNAGTAPGGTDIMTFDSGDKMSPFLAMLGTTDFPTSVKLLAAEGGPMAARSTETLLALAGATA